MSDIFRTLILPADVTPLARGVACALAPNSAGMWTVGLSPDGTEPPTHYIATGYIPPAWQVMVPTQFWHYDGTQWVKTGETPGDSLLVWQQATAAGMVVSQAEIDALYAVADVTAQNPQLAMARLGLQLIVPPDPDTPETE